MKYDEILKIIKKYLSSSKEPHNKQLQMICQILLDEISNYDWVGFYFIKEGKLQLSSYAGEPTEHTTIKIGEGICGQAAAIKKIFVVNNYL